jgi:hypothetical protein
MAQIPPQGRPAEVLKIVKMEGSGKSQEGI